LKNKYLCKGLNMSENDILFSGDNLIDEGGFLQSSVKNSIVLLSKGLYQECIA